jgi:hypothetical protein
MQTALESWQLTGHDGAQRRGQLHRDQDEKRSVWASGLVQNSP